MKSAHLQPRAELTAALIAFRVKVESTTGHAHLYEDFEKIVADVRAYRNAGCEMVFSLLLLGLGRTSEGRRIVQSFLMDDESWVRDLAKRVLEPQNS